MDTPISVADLLTYLTTSGVAIYVVGLVGLAIAIRLELTDDISTAWYAVALLPRTIVAGQGVRIWLRWTVPYAIFAAGLGALVVGFLKAGNIAVTAFLALLIPASGLGLLALFYVAILKYLQKEVKQLKEEEERQKGPKQPDTRFKWLPYPLNSVLKWLILPVPPKRAEPSKGPKQPDTRFKWLPYPLNSVLKWLILPVPPKRTEPSKPKTGQVSPRLPGHFIFATIMSGLGGITMSLGAFIVMTAIGGENVNKIVCRETDIRGAICTADVSSIVSAVANDPSQGVFSGLMLFIAGGFLVGISAAATVEHPLPRAKIVRHRSFEPFREGYLVTHADGFWYFLDEKAQQLVSIPDAQVSEVRLVKEAE
jgi:hypothetical protein